MRLILWLLALFAAAVTVTFAAKYNTGHVLLVLSPYQVELSLNIFIMALLVAFFIFYFLLRLILGLFGFNQRHRHKKADEMMLTGLKAFFEGDYIKAKRSASTALKLADAPTMKVINAVIAARSAHKLGAFKLRDEFLSLAEKGAPEERTVRLVTQTELLLNETRYEEALNVLQTLYSTGGLQQTAVLQLELEAQQQAKNWDAVLDLIYLLEKRHPFNKASIEQLKLIAHLENIQLKASDPQLLNKYWQNLTTIEKRNSKLAVAATRAYISQGDCATAHHIIEQYVDVEWNSELITLYAECLDYHVNRQIECAEVWLKSQPNNAHLLLTLGKLCAHCELWGKAQNYLEASLSVEPGHAAHLALAQLSEKLGKHELAMSHYNKGLGFTLEQLS
ncbi:HemY protein [Nitrosomonas cryotolerans]|uniref:HemY protein n=1 Tax=Nitrosomonas cryotolerans ATCC 49181 TaxID=1131553 RepID=A0A1N6FF71_9PROT|nr:heme biosynthesis protein HemY [Nitrosomonas cryotolerans]SFP63346.1 HemY protein [Nitrosomonas cryotolerans]SIN93905.1 HemY protein [Nitrosomonas cryotolerans ATCC 49181]